MVVIGKSADLSVQKAEVCKRQVHYSECNFTARRHNELAVTVTYYMSPGVLLGPGSREK